MKKRWIVIGSLLLLASGCLGWFFYKTPDFLGSTLPGKNNANAEIKTGSYWRILHRYARPTPVAVTVIRLDIDRVKGQAVFHMQDGSTVQAALAGAEQVQWTTGCPTNVRSTRMEFLPLAQDRLALGDTTFEHPYLEGTCPAPPFVIVLGEGTNTGEGLSDASACDWYHGAKCVYFGQGYVTLHVQVCDRASGEPLPQASLTLETPAGNQEYPGTFQVKLPGNARFPFTASAPGYTTYLGSLEIESGMVVVSTASAGGEPLPASVIEKIVTTEEVNINIYLDK